MDSKFLSSKVVGGIFLMGTMLAGCSEGNAEVEDPSKEAVEAVLMQEFTAPNEEFVELREAIFSQLDENTQTLQADAPEVVELNDFIEETYGPYFTESELDKLVNTGQAFAYHTDGDYQLTIVEMDVEQNEVEPTLYTFSLEVDYMNPAGDVKAYDIEGKAMVPESGKIGRLSVGDPDSLQAQIFADTLE